MKRFTDSLVLGGTFGLVIAAKDRVLDAVGLPAPLHLPVVAPFISMMHFDSRAISRELNGRTRTATLTDDILVPAPVALLGLS